MIIKIRSDSDKNMFLSSDNKKSVLVLSVAKFLEVDEQ
jgi:hypothetical protein